MKAVLLLRERLFLSAPEMVEIVIWRVPKAVTVSNHLFKYSLAFVVDGVCRVRYDNEAGKGDHKHIDETQMPHRFVDLATMQTDFWNDVEAKRSRR